MIVRAGEGRAKVYEAVKAFGEGDAAGYRRALEEADEKLLQAHDVQTRYMRETALVSEAGRSKAPSFLLVHAQDILMAATSEKDLAVAVRYAVLLDAHTLALRVAQHARGYPVAVDPVLRACGNQHRSA